MFCIYINNIFKTKIFFKIYYLILLLPGFRLPPVLYSQQQQQQKKKNDSACVASAQRCLAVRFLVLIHVLVYVANQLGHLKAYHNYTSCYDEVQNVSGGRRCVACVLVCRCTGDCRLSDDYHVLQ